MREQWNEIDPDGNKSIKYVSNNGIACDAHRSDDDFAQMKKKTKEDV